jgi:uncharacterized DUF497 family protein
VAKQPQFEFEWNASNQSHLARHRISRSEFEQAMRNDPMFIKFSDESGEERWYAVGATEGLRVLYLVFTYRGERVRPITGWDANKKLQEAYFRSKDN